MEKSIIIDNNLEQDYDLPAPELGKAWRCKVNGSIYTGSIKLATIYCMGGKWLKKSIQEKLEDYELIGIPEGML